MKRRWIAYAVWLLLTACLYFFENNTGTRAVFVSSLLFPFIPLLRSACFSPDETEKTEIPETQTVRNLIRFEPDEPDDLRPYMPGDPIQRIHWKLSAKTDELLVRNTVTGKRSADKEKKNVSREKNGRKKVHTQAVAWMTAGILLCILLLLFIPEANRGARMLCNSVYTASEEMNSYEYRHFSVPEQQSTGLAVSFLLCISVLLVAMTVILRSRFLMMGIMAACTLFQVYFGLPFPVWICIPLYGLFAVWMLRRPVILRNIVLCCTFLLIVSVLVMLFLPGTDTATEAASEAVRDRLALVAERIAGTVQEIPEGETETRHIHSRSLESGEREDGTDQEFRLVTVEEEEISMPHWVDWMKMVLLMLLAVALVILPFCPFLLLSIRKKRGQEIRKTFGAENVSEAVQHIFRQIILWLEVTEHGAGNLLYRDWTHQLPDNLPEGYAERFAQCAADYEEAVYSDHEMPEQKRRNALDLLKETETALWQSADRRKRFYLRYWMGLYE